MWRKIGKVFGFLWRHKKVAAEVLSVAAEAWPAIDKVMPVVQVVAEIAAKRGGRAEVAKLLGVADAGSLADMVVAWYYKTGGTAPEREVRRAVELAYGVVRDKAQPAPRQ